MKGITVAEEISDAADDVGGDEVPSATVPRRISVSMRTFVVGLIMAALVAGCATTTWMYIGERGIVAADARQAAADEHAEQIALDYAVNAASMNFKDMNGWKEKLVQGTSAPLHDKLTKAAQSMEQLLIPLEWTSTSSPLTAKVRSQTNGVYVVDTFVSVLTKTTQAPDNLQSTATYSITIDSNNGWQITDVGGIGAVAGAK
ncbi:hypothetical protein MycrhDRAFT_0957 [Mycolicibacterium rhodesiae JS60]|nr:hypothetical protein MycrhDRAFT_0957 [Mycolicibacterium rhodesiae JS60]